ncbi:MAG: GNAT family protein [Candidatus Gracilibacteria bacterium]|nr:GNAT family protein [Candidatus Gracilibacteria bacterium]
MKKFNKDFIMETERLFVKIPDYSHAKYFFELIDENVSKFMVWSLLSSPESYYGLIDDRIELAEKGIRWDAIIIEKQSGNMIGNFGVVVYDESINGIELGYWLGVDYQGKGYITECVEKIKKIGFDDFGYNRILIKATKENISSTNVAKRCGFHFDGVLRNDAYIKGKYVDKAYYTFLKEEYIK